MVSRWITVDSPEGLHLRPAGILCQMANEYICRIELRCVNNYVDAKSVLSVLEAAITGGSRIQLVCDGRDEDNAVKELGDWMEKEL